MRDSRRRPGAARQAAVRGRPRATSGSGAWSATRSVHRSVLRRVRDGLAAAGIDAVAAMPSPLRGADGNVEFFFHARTDGAPTPQGRRTGRHGRPRGHRRVVVTSAVRTVGLVPHRERARGPRTGAGKRRNGSPITAWPSACPRTTPVRAASNTWRAPSPSSPRGSTSSCRSAGTAPCCARSTWSTRPASRYSESTSATSATSRRSIPTPKRWTVRSRSCWQGTTTSPSGLSFRSTSRPAGRRRDGGGR